MTLAIRFLGSFFMLYMSYLDTQSTWTTVILALVFIALEINTWMFRHLSKQAKYLESILDEIRDLVK